MLSITVKTMDSQSRQFQVPEMTTIREFKNKIVSSVEIPTDRQRLIFQGRVLPDDFKLTKDHDGKVLHLVQRMPVSATTVASAGSTSTSSTTTTSNTNPVFNPAQLSQMIFQQAMGGLGSLMNGSAVTGSVGPNPNNPAEHMMNIHIDLNPSGNPNSAPTNTASGSSSHPQHHHEHHHRSNVSAPRQQLQVANSILNQLSSTLDNLENMSSSAPTSITAETTPVQESSATESDQAGDVFASDFDQSPVAEESMVTSTDQSSAANTSTSTAPTQTSSSSQTGTSTTTSEPTPRPTCVNHPSLGELSTYFSRLLLAQRRLEPFISETITFLSDDPAFNSTQSPEYRSTARMLTLTLQAQRMLAEIQRILSSVVIPLGRTPPRTMLLRAPPGATHPPPGARRVTNLAHGGGQPFQFQRPRAGVPRFNATRFGFEIPGGGMRPRMVPVAHGMQMRVSRVPANASTGTNQPVSSTSIYRFGSMNSATTNTNAQTQPAAPTSAAVASGTDTPTTGEANTSTAGGSTRINVAPPTYSVLVNATIQPQIVINVASGTDSLATNTSTTTTSSTTSAGGITSQQSSANANVHQNQTEATNDGSGSTAGIIPNIPNIPGVPQDILSSLFRTVAQSAQGSPGQQQPTSSGIFVVQGPPGGPNQISEDVSNIIGQTVFNTVYNQLTGSSQPSSAQGNSTAVRVSLSNSFAPGSTSTPTTTSSGRDAFNRNTSQNVDPAPSNPPISSANSTSPTAMDTTTATSSNDSTTKPKSNASSELDKQTSKSEAASSSSNRQNFSDSSSGVIEDMTGVLLGGNFGSRGAGGEPQDRRFLVNHNVQDIGEIMDILRSESSRRTVQPRPSPSQSAHTSSYVERTEEENSEIFHRAIRNVTSGIDMNLDLNQPANEFVRQLGFSLPERNEDQHDIIGMIFHALAEELTCAEILGVMQQSPAPLNKVRHSLQRLISREYFAGALPTSVGDIEMVSQVLSELIRDYITTFFSKARVIPDVDIIESNLSLLRHSFKRAMEILFLADNMSYAIDLNKHIHYVICTWIRLNESLLRGGRKELTKLIKTFEHFQRESTMSIITVIEQIYANPSQPDTEPFGAFLQHLTTFASVTQDQIDQFVLSQAPERVESDTAVSPEAKTDDKHDSPMETDANPSLPADPTPTTSNMTHTPSSSHPSSSRTHTVVDAGVGTGEDWKKQVPAEWVDTIAADKEVQNNLDPQPSFSDAYRVGMPASKRRKVVS